MQINNFHLTTGQLVALLLVGIVYFAVDRLDIDPSFRIEFKFGPEQGDQRAVQPTPAAPVGQTPMPPPLYILPYPDHPVNTYGTEVPGPEPNSIPEPYQERRRQRPSPPGGRHRNDGSTRARSKKSRKSAQRSGAHDLPNSCP